MTTMKMDEEFGTDRVIDVETDDEHYEAGRDCSDDNSSSNSYASGSRRSNNNIVDDIAAAESNAWPQTYRKSMDIFTTMTPPSLGFVTRSGSLTSPHKRSQPSILDQSSLSQPLILPTSLDKEEVPTSTFPTRFSSTSNIKLSLHELPRLPKCSYSQSIINAFNVLCGIGILSMPYALKEGGWWSILLLLLLGIITCYTGILLQRCLESSPTLQTYPDIGQAAFGVTGRICIATVLYIELYSSCVEYLIMMCDNLSALFPNAHVDFAGIHLESYYLCAIVSTLVILPTVWLRDLSLLSYVSAGGVVTLALVVICLFWVGTVDEVGFHHAGTAFDLRNLPVAIGLYGFCYGGHSVFPNVYSSMKEPSRFPSVLIISFLTSGLLYMGVGICGYLMFGNAVKSQFTLNMPTKFVASKVAAWTVVVAPVTKYALTITPVAFALEELLPSAHHRSHSVSILIRTLLVISTLVVAMAIPFFGSVMALIGSLLVMLVALVFPCACYLSVHRSRVTNSQIVVCVAIICVGVMCAIIGTHVALAEIKEGYLKQV